MIPQLLVQALSPLFEGRFYSGNVPGDALMPFASYQLVGGESVSFIDKARPSKVNARVQINTWAASRMEAYMLALAVEDAMRETTLFQADPIGASMDRDEPDLNMFGQQQDFTVWADR